MMKQARENTFVLFKLNKKNCQTDFQNDCNEYVWPFTDKITLEVKTAGITLLNPNWMLNSKYIFYVVISDTLQSVWGASRSLAFTDAKLSYRFRKCRKKTLEGFAFIFWSSTLFTILCSWDLNLTLSIHEFKLVDSQSWLNNQHTAIIQFIPRRNFLKIALVCGWKFHFWFVTQIRFITQLFYLASQDGLMFAGIFQVSLIC